MPRENCIRVVIADDHAIVREGIAEVLTQAGGFDVVGHTSDGEEAVRMVEELRPEMVVMDILMPVKNGIEACREIAASVPETRVLMLTASNNQAAIVESVDASAAGYLQKYSNREMLVATVSEAAAGEFRVQGEAARRLLSGMSRGGTVPMAPTDVERLTAREREILRMFARGMTYAEIGEVRGNNPMSVRNALYAMQKKIGVGSRQEIGVWAARSGLLDDDELA